jgi:hypothetical protein
MNISEEPAAIIFRVEDRCFCNENQGSRFLRKNGNQTIDRKWILEIHLHVTRKYEAHYTDHFIYLNTLHVSECLNRSHLGSMIIIVTGFSVLSEVHARGYHGNHCCLVVCSLWCMCCYATPAMTAIVMGFCVMLLAKEVFITGTKCVQSELWTVAEGSWVLSIQQLDGGTVLKLMHGLV